MKTMIYCEPTERGVHSFFMGIDGHECYLFSQDCLKGVQEYYANGALLNESLDFTKPHKDSAVVRTMSKIPMYVKHIEKKYGIEIFEQTKKKNKYCKFIISECA